jgi:hypothetical protein
MVSRAAVAVRVQLCAEQCDQLHRDVDGLDLYNEPMNSGMGDASIPLVLEVFDWGREVNPSQPLSMDEWSGKLYKIIGDQVDVVTFHNYEPPQGLQNEIDQLKKWDRFDGGGLPVDLQG